MSSLPLSMRNFYILMITAVFCSGCENKQTVEGLWIVKTVTVGDQEMTPNARWMKFNSDFTQQSGNGWFQHSIGTWTLDTDELKIFNTNGLDDPYQAFEMTLSDDEMKWKRIEDDQSVEIHLERSDQLPVTHGDKILGLWKLEQAVGDGNYFSETDNSTNYIFFRWDKRFLIGTDSSKYRGVYQVNGHKPQIELIPYDEKIKRNTWEINFDSNEITLRELNSDSIVKRKFKRIHEFPK